MSKIYGEKQETVIRKIKRKVTGIQCDCCKKVITADVEYLSESKYYNVTTGHNDWARDSVDSIKNCHVCPDCIGKFVTDYLNDPEGYDSAYINVETDYITDGWYDSNYESED